MSTRDTQRARVYAAEQFVRTMFDRAAQHSSRAIDFFGTSLTLPPEAKFGSVDSVQRYVDDVVTRVGAGPVAVRSRRGATAAHYELVDRKAVIAVPERDTWALRELVMLFGHWTAVTALYLQWRSGGLRRDMRPPALARRRPRGLSNGGAEGMVWDVSVEHYLGQCLSRHLRSGTTGSSDSSAPRAPRVVPLVWHRVEVAVDVRASSSCCNQSILMLDHR